MNTTKALIFSFCLAAASTLSAAPASLLLTGFEEPLTNEFNATARNQVPLLAEKKSALVKEGRSSALWVDLQQNAWVSLKKVPSDWSAYEALSIWIHSEVANGQVLNFTVGSDNMNGGGDYFIHQVTVDWTGWKQVIMPFDLFKKNRSPKGWDAITGIQIASRGWGGVQALPDSVLHLDKLELIRR